MSTAGIISTRLSACCTWYQGPRIYPTDISVSAADRHHHPMPLLLQLRKSTRHGASRRLDGAWCAHLPGAHTVGAHTVCTPSGRCRIAQRCGYGQNAAERYAKPRQRLSTSPEAGIAERVLIWRMHIWPACLDRASHRIHTQRLTPSDFTPSDTPSHAPEQSTEASTTDPPTASTAAAHSPPDQARTTSSEVTSPVTDIARAQLPRQQHAPTAAGYVPHCRRSAHAEPSAARRAATQMRGVPCPPRRQCLQGPDVKAPTSFPDTTPAK
jgi:hypothetical protein